MAKPSKHGRRSSVSATSAITPPTSLHEREGLIWQALATHGPLHITAIARHTGLHRPAIYQHLRTLEAKHLIEVCPGAGRTHYQTTGIAALKQYMNSTWSPWKEALASAATASPSLPPDVRVYRGAELRRVWEELAQAPKHTVIYRYDAYPASTRIDALVPESYKQAIRSRQLERFVITNHALRNRSYVRRIECASRMLPPSFDSFEFGVTTFVFGSTLALVDLTQEVAYVIDNPVLARFYQRLFQYQYANLQE